MRIACLADLHGMIPLEREMPAADILVIAGDIGPHEPSVMRDWIARTFNPWLDTLKYDKVISVAGNHDWLFEVDSQAHTLLNCVYLQDSGIEHQGVKFYGYPWTPRFCDWAFNSSTRALKAHVANIPEDTNVLITHGPPRGLLDAVCRGTGSIEHVGDLYLAKRYYNEFNPTDDAHLKAHIFGHLHCDPGITERRGVKVVNASYLNEAYRRDPDAVIPVIEI